MRARSESSSWEKIQTLRRSSSYPMPAPFATQPVWLRAVFYPPTPRPARSASMGVPPADTIPVMNPLDRLGPSADVGWAAASILAGYRWVSWRSRRLPPDEAKQRLSEYHRRSAQRILETATRRKGLLIKVGQIMGARADVFPDEYVEVLSQLHDTVPPHPLATIRAMIEE